ncbi:hypothetical protein Mterra_01198 [Calidithermus terrae]|uniref:DUF3108 domain-containing protein n=1 Tax=Calidithermus terrae TaxID=1408545 RepID=A0A399EVJ1_9DEIN|nr:hypothetical protein [Calidithermus terrae]RIH87446.1 hypothetical protein Mterra_01198 [Calidithermus terrae]
MKHWAILLLSIAAFGLGWAKCDHPYYPVREGWTWTYKQSGQVNETYSLTVTNVSDQGFTLRYTTKESSFELRWRCDANGLMSLDQGSFGQNQGFKLETTNAKGVAIPSQFRVGLAWTYSYDLKGSFDSGGQKMTMTGKSSTDAKITAREAVKVPAGTFQAFKVETTTKTEMAMNVGGQSQPMPAQSFGGTTWYAEGVGMVKSVMAGITTELVSLKK